MYVSKMVRACSLARSSMIDNYNPKVWYVSDSNRLGMKLPCSAVHEGVLNGCLTRRRQNPPYFAPFRAEDS